MTADELKRKAAELRGVLFRVDIDDCVSELIGVGNAITLDSILRAVAGGEIEYAAGEDWIVIRGIQGGGDG